MKRVWALISFIFLMEARLMVCAAPPVLNATASVLNGVAPLGVFFDATNTTSNVAPDTFTEIEYEWTFGDSGSGTWSTTGQSKNSAFGALGFHVFESPGTYQVQLIARDAQGGTSQQNFTITVTDPNVVFSGANTVCFSPTDFVGCPAGAQQVTTSQWLDLQPYVATGKRLLLRRGATFGVAWTLDINANGPGVINAFGSGAKPIVQSNNDITILYGPIQNPPSDWRIGGLDLRGSYPATTNPGDGVQLGRQFLFHDNDIRGVNFAVYMGPTKSHQYIVGNNILNNKGYGAYLDSAGADSYAVVMGNILSTDGSGGAHLVRTYISKGLLSHNHFNVIGVAQHQLKFCGTVAPIPPAQKCIISSNHFNDPGRPGSWMISVGPEDTFKFQKVQDVIFERNLVQSVAQNAMIGLQSRGADRVTVRNNVFNNIANAVSAGQPVPGFSTWNNWRVLNNSYLNLTTPDGALINSDGPMPGIIIKNNVVSMPNSSVSNAVYAANLFQTSKSNITESHNLWHFPLLPPTQNVFHVQEGLYTNSSWANQTCANATLCGQSTLTSDPMYVNGANGNLQLQTGSTALDSGTPLPQVLSDFTGQPRHATNPDRGAYELGVGGSNAAPVVNAGPNQTITFPANMVTLSGVVSDDGNPNPPGQTTVLWSRVSGPGSVTFGNTSALSTTATFAQSGTYILRLTANDGALSTSDDVQIVVNSDPNQPPSINAGPNQGIILPTNVANLSGVVTDDGLPNPPGTTTVQWTSVSGPASVTFGNADAAATTVTFTQTGTYVLRLTANDSALSAYDEIQIVVNAAGTTNQAPFVSAGSNQNVILPSLATLVGSASDDGLPNPPGTLSHLWLQMSGPGASQIATPSALTSAVSFPQAGTYVLRLHAYDGEVLVFDDVQMTVSAAPGSGNQPSGNNPTMTDTRILPCSNPQDPSERSRIPVCFQLKESGNVSITIYSRQGKKVRELLNGHRDAGENRVDWDLKDDSGNPVASGPCNVFFESNNIRQKKKLMVIR